AEGWSLSVPKEVTAVKGKPAVLPCTFTYPPSVYSGKITAIWRVHPYLGPEIFRCTMENSTSADCIVDKNEKSRYRLVGDPRQNNLSLLIDNVTYEDSNSYHCRVELSSKAAAMFQTQSGTRLHVTLPSTILSLSTVIDTAGFSLLCLAEGKPLPTITWIGPGNREIPATNNTGLDSKNSSLWYQIEGKIQNVMEGEIYTCKADNKYGTAEQNI
uniref:Ig-like domain-containing protein n=1 Tax=Latimeria chalumnae TaxID=7897 RepID=H2ZXM9_LATCH